MRDLKGGEMEVTLMSITPDAEKLIETAGRVAYQSFDRQAEGSEKRFIRMLIKRGHESVLEHAHATVRIRGVSRALTHQLVRHRLCSFTQKSQRWVSENNFTYVTPNSIKNRSEACVIYDSLMNTIKDAYNTLVKFGMPKEDARFVLPNATSTEIVVTANFREWRHILRLRGARQAQWEIRKLAIKILELLKEHAPTVFGDLVVNKEKEVIEVLVGRETTTEGAS